MEQLEAFWQTQDNFELRGGGITTRSGDAEKEVQEGGSAEQLWPELLHPSKLSPAPENKAQELLLQARWWPVPLQLWPALAQPSKLSPGPLKEVQALLLHARWVPVPLQV